jgi:hypothetical protein
MSDFLARSIERGNIDQSLKERINRILDVEREALKRQGYPGLSRLAVVAKLLDLGVKAWEETHQSRQA